MFGSLPRPPDLLEMIRAKDNTRPLADVGGETARPCSVGCKGRRATQNVSTSPWAALRLRSRAGAILLEYSDSTGLGFGCAFAPGQECPRAIKEHISELAQHGRIAMFLDPETVGRVDAVASAVGRSAREARTTAALEVLFKLAQSVGDLGAQIQAVYLAAGPWPERSPFELPLNVLTIGAATRWLRDAIASHPWLQEIRKEDAGLTTTGNWIRELLNRKWRGTEPT
jgi:hypothetical protein